MVFEMTKEPYGLRIEFSSIMSNIDVVDAATREFLARMSLGSHAFAICLVMREALTNAVRHGNRSDDTKLVAYHIYLDDDSIVLDIIDQGEGFVWKELMEMDAPEPDQESGRGLAIMKSYFSSCFFNEKGNRIILTKKI
ncbi:ATP-binding protein [Desulforegula conservatrix]|uniref:ATP-binding protein n=1 Tax=Desulforegula conservatrix TaxID=153026 RepID=UPI0003FC81D0|nr:ATP-binding protein [Desulforegula conservatrix]